jgi:hypothetical protein
MSKLNNIIEPNDASVGSIKRRVDETGIRSDNYLQVKSNPAHTIPKNHPCRDETCGENKVS